MPGLASPHPLGERLPAMYQEDGFVQRLTGALDEVLAPILGSLDSFEAYIDPDLAPADFLQWLGGWVGLAMDDSLPADRRRAVLTDAISLYRTRGTARGLAAHLQLFTGAPVEIEESGGTAFSTTPDPPPPGASGFELVVRIRVDDADELDVERLDALVAAAKPAHVVHRLEVGPRAEPEPPPRAEPPPAEE